MKDIRFYLEYPNAKEKRNATRKNLGNHSNTIIAIDTDSKDFVERHGEGTEGDSYEMVYFGFATVGWTQSSGVNYCTVGADYLAERCKRISEQQAREIHPALFERLDD